MKLFKLYLSDCSTQEVLANKLSQALKCARGNVAGYVCYSEWDW